MRIHAALRFALARAALTCTRALSSHPAVGMRVNCLSLRLRSSPRLSLSQRSLVLRTASAVSFPCNTRAHRSDTLTGYEPKPIASLRTRALHRKRRARPTTVEQIHPASQPRSGPSLSCGESVFLVLVHVVDSLTPHTSAHQACVCSPHTHGQGWSRTTHASTSPSSAARTGRD